MKILVHNASSSFTAPEFFSHVFCSRHVARQFCLVTGSRSQLAGRALHRRLISLTFPHAALLGHARAFTSENEERNNHLFAMHHNLYSQLSERETFDRSTYNQKARTRQSESFTFVILGNHMVD